MSKKSSNKKHTIRCNVKIIVKIQPQPCVSKLRVKNKRNRQRFAGQKSTWIINMQIKYQNTAYTKSPKILTRDCTSWYLSTYLFHYKHLLTLPLYLKRSNILLGLSCVVRHKIYYNFFFCKWLISCEIISSFTKS